jgi:hypothetical protein
LVPLSPRSRWFEQRNVATARSTRQSGAGNTTRSIARSVAPAHEHITEKTRQAPSRRSHSSSRVLPLDDYAQFPKKAEERCAAAHTSWPLAARYALRLTVGRGEAVANQLSWMEARTPWLHKATPATGTVALERWHSCSFSRTGNGTGIGSQLCVSHR